MSTRLCKQHMWEPVLRNPLFRRILYLFGFCAAIGAIAALVLLRLWSKTGSSFLLLVAIGEMAALGGLICLFCFCVRNVYKPYVKILRKTQSPGAASPGYLDMLDKITTEYETAVSSRDSAELLKIRAELDAMQSQINPHFLYNTLDSIRSQAIEDGSDVTATMIETLSSLFRYTISQKNDMQTVFWELKNVKNYIKIQQYRFSNKYELLVLIPDTEYRIMDYKIPKLTLQPIIENCIFHGLREKQGLCTIVIQAYTTQSTLVITVSDNGVGMDEKQLQNMNLRFANNEYISTRSGTTSSSGQGIALINVNARIKLLYGPKYGLTAYSALGEGTDIQITFPFNGQGIGEGCT